MKKVTKILLGLVACTFILGLAACKEDNTENSASSSSSVEQGPTNSTEHTHTYVPTEQVEPTCTEQGYTVYICSCEESYNEDYVDALGHDYVDAVCGNCGKDFRNELTFELNSNASYSVTGVGTCTDSEIIIPATYNDLPVTTIGAKAFSICKTLTSLVIPDSVTTIEENAFFYCNNLTSLAIPDSVTTIGDSAFSSCMKLASVAIPDSVTTIGNSAFSSCGLTSVAIPDSVTTIGEEAFSSCSGLTSVRIGDGVTTIGADAFRGCSKLTSVYYNGDVEGWCNISFNQDPEDPVYLINYANPIYYAKNLYIDNELVTELVIPETVTEIKAHTFYNCSSLTSVEIGSNLTAIGAYAFRDCSGLTSVYYNGDVAGWCNISFGNEEANPMRYAKDLYIDHELVTGELVIPETVTEIKAYAFYNCSSLTSVYYNGDVEGWCNISFGDSANPMRYATDLYIDNELITELVIPETVTEIKASAFSGCGGLTSVKIPDSVTVIGEDAFSGCDSLTSVYYDGDVEGWCDISFGSIFASPMYYATDLYIDNELVTELVIPETMTEIKAYAFYKCDSLTSVKIPDSVIAIDKFAFWGCSSLTSVEIGDGVTTIENSAFSHCSSLTSLEIPDSVTEIGGDAFANCSSLTSVVIGGGVTEMGSYAFQECGSLTSVVISDGVTEISRDAFKNCSSLTSVKIPDSVTEIGESAFSDCSGLTSVVIGDGVGKIGFDTFGGCSSLKSVVIGDGVTTICMSAFIRCSSLTSVLIGAGVTIIDLGAFLDCNRLTSVYYKGTEAEWNAIAIGTYNAKLVSAMRYYYSETEPALNATGTAYVGRYWHYDTDGVTPVVWFYVTEEE